MEQAANIFVWNWGQLFFNLIPALLGAFLGFGSSLLLQRRKEKKEYIELLNKVKSSVKAEVAHISDDFIKPMELGINEDRERIESVVISTPVWSALTHTRMIVDMIADESYEPIKAFYSLMEMFGNRGKNFNYESFFTKILKESEKIEKL